MSRSRRRLGAARSRDVRASGYPKLESFIGLKISTCFVLLSVLLLISSYWTLVIYYIWIVIVGMVGFEAYGFVAVRKEVFCQFYFELAPLKVAWHICLLVRSVQGEHLYLRACLTQTGDIWTMTSTRERTGLKVLSRSVFARWMTELGIEYVRTHPRYEYAFSSKCRCTVCLLVCLLSGHF